eukprot:m.64966 g.64966  ORF g.64966 m.64966 type:complete len:790 (-) comp11691_c0_seq1:1602-3971(-)
MHSTIRALMQWTLLTLTMCAPPPSPMPPAPGTSGWVDFQRPADKSFQSRWNTMTGNCMNSTAWQELEAGLKGMLGEDAPHAVNVYTTTSTQLVVNLTNPNALTWPPDVTVEGYDITQRDLGSGHSTVISSRSLAGLLRGVLRFLILVRSATPGLDTTYTESSYPSTPLRVWDLWDNQDESVERGYGGKSVFQWSQLPKMYDRYTTYARMLASLGINAIVWDNVNACGNDNQHILESSVIQSFTPLVSLFLDYGIYSMLTPCYTSPQTIGNATTNDPEDDAVKAFWANKAKELSTTWPSGAFRGFLIKADCEGEPGPGRYNRTELEGANLMGRALDPVGAIVIWRAFSHPPQKSMDQALYQFEQFYGWNGKTDDNVVLQTKNGPFDFQVREPVHSLFANLTNVSLILEFEVTQEYLGQSKHLAHLPSQWEYYLSFDTCFGGTCNRTLGEVVSGTLSDERKKYSGIAGVSNLGSDFDWTGGAFSLANAYGYGRLAWNPAVGAKTVTREWLNAMFDGSDNASLQEVEDMMLSSWIAYENYTSSLGWGFSCSMDHYTMEPSIRNGIAINASKTHIGYNRGIPNAFGATYPAPLAKRLLAPESTPEELLLCFHNVPYNYTLSSGLSVLEFIIESHRVGAVNAQGFVDRWSSLKGQINLDVYRGNVSHDDITTQLQQGATDAQTFNSTVVDFILSQIHSSPSPPPPSPPNPPGPSPFSGFNKFPNAFCKMGTVPGALLAEKTGLSLQQCHDLCTGFGSKCACFDYNGQLCRAKTVHDPVHSSDFTSYVRQNATLI